jgi:hypothetical protein
MSTTSVFDMPNLDAIIPMAICIGFAVAML